MYGAWREIGYYRIDPVPFSHPLPTTVLVFHLIVYLQRQCYQLKDLFRRHFYVGSANFDWRSLTQVKEIGVLAMNCPKLAEDMTKIYEVYWALGGPGKTIPDK